MNKISRTFTLAAAVLASGGAWAAMPYTAPFGGDGFGVDNSLSITGSTLSVACPPTAALCVNFEGGSGVDGIIQRRVVMPDGTNYLQSIVAEGDGVTNLFASEQIVRMGINGGTNSTNIAQKMKILEASGASSSFSTDHTMLGADYYSGVDLLFGLNQRIDENEPGNALDQLTRIVGEITGAGGDLNGNGGGATGAKRVAIDQWAGAVEPGAGNATPAGFFVYRTGQNTGTVIDLEDVNNAPGLSLANYNSALYIQSRQSADTGLNHQRVTSAIGNNGAATVTSGSVTRTAITGATVGPWDWNGSGADAGGAVSAIFGDYTDQTTTALDMW